MSKEANACDISQEVKKKVFERDGGKCVVCGNTINVMPNAHIVPRSAGGLGIETNIVTLCSNFSENQCHFKYDFGTKEEKAFIEAVIVKHMKKCYGEQWCKADQYYKKDDLFKPPCEEESGNDDWF